MLQIARKYLHLHSVWSVTTSHLSYRPRQSPSHLLRTSSNMNFFRIQHNFILYEYTHTFFSFFPLFLFYLIFFCILIYYYYNFFSCSGIFRDVPECSMFLVLSTAIRVSTFPRYTADCGNIFVSKSAMRQD